MNRLSISVTVLLLGIVLPHPAVAYIGPGAGLSAIGTVVAVIGAFLLLLVGFVWYPVKRMLRGRKSTRNADGNERAKEVSGNEQAEDAVKDKPTGAKS